MAKALVVSTWFTAIDKFTHTISKMTAGVNTFAAKTQLAMAKVERAERKVRTGFSNLLGKLGQLGLAFGALSVAMMVGGANIQLEDNLASLSSITGVTGDAFKAFEKQIDIVSKKQKMFAGDTAKAFEIIGSAKPELLSSADALAQVSEAAIILSKASKDDLATSAINLTGAMNQFSLAADQSNRVINVLSAGSVVGAANISEITESMKNVGTVAASSNLSLEKTVAGIEVLGQFALKGAEAGTKFRGVILRLQAANLGYASGQFDINDALEEFNKKSNKFKTAAQQDAFASKIFGAENITAGKILSNNIALFDEYTKGVTGTNMAVVQAGINTNTLSSKFNEMVAAFKNSVTSTNLQSESMQKLKGILIFVADNMEKIIGVTTVLIATFVAYKTIMIATKAAIIGWNIVMGISTALMGKSAFYVHGNTVAYASFRAAVLAQTAATWAWNIALKASAVASAFYTSTLVPAIASTWAFTTALLSNPITWIVVGIMALVAGIVLLIKNFDKVVEWTKKAGKSILSFLLAPIEMVLAVINKLSGGKWAGESLAKIKDFRANLTTTNEQEALNPDAAAEQVRIERSEKTKNENVRIQVEAAKGSNASVLEDQSNRIQLTPTLGWT